MSGSQSLPARSDLDLAIDTQWMLMQHAITAELRIAHCRKWRELCREREMRKAPDSEADPAGA